MNEYLRATLTLDAWMWFFAFARIELILGFLASSIPFLVYQSKTAGEVDAEVDTGSSGEADAD